jgi:hypothetical protein
MGRTCSKKENECIQDFGRRSTRMGPPGRSRRRRDGDIKTDPKEKELSIMDWIQLAQNRDRLWYILPHLKSLYIYTKKLNKLNPKCIK